MATQSAQHETGERVGVIFVHGVGETPPGWINRSIVDRLDDRRKDLQTTPHAEFHELADRGSSRPGTYFPAYVRRAAIGNRSISYLELYWADLSKTSGGPAMFLLAALQLFYEAPFILAHSLMAGRRSPYHWVLKQLVLAATWLLRWPIAGMNVTAFTVFLVLLLLSYAKLTPPLPLAMTLSIILAVVTVAAFAIARWRLHRDLWITDVSMATGIVSGLSIIAVAVLNGLLPAHMLATPGAYLALMMPPILYVWVVWGIVIAVAIVLLLPIYLKRAMGFKPRYYFPVARPASALGLAVMQGLIWKVFMTLPGVWLIDAVLALPTASGPPPHPGHSLALLFSGDLTRCTAPANELMRLACQLFDASPEETLSDAVIRLKGVFVFNSLHALYALVAFVAIIVVRQAIARTTQPAAVGIERPASKGRIGQSRLPRVILSQFIIGVLFAGSLATLYVYWAGLYQSEFFLRQVPGVRSVWLWPPLFAILFAVAYFFNIFQTVAASLLHIFRDVVDHQYRPRFKMLEFVMPAATMRTKSRWPRRGRIQERMNVLVEKLVRGEQFDRLIFVGHSQGSVILFDYLSATEDNEDLASVQRIDVVTVGSPLTHIYQYYFNDYGDAKADAAALNPKLKSWTNFWRIDDPVGNRVDIVAGGFVRNIELPPGGHVDYWRESDVLSVMLDLIEGPSTVATAAPVSPTATATPAELSTKLWPAVVA
jgi:hypothetical protein